MILGQNLKFLVCLSVFKVDQEMMFGYVLEWWEEWVFMNGYPGPSLTSMLDTEGIILRLNTTSTKSHSEGIIKLPARLMLPG